jgi:glycosyltransferase involved in cell wall biosynthesis
MRIAYVCADQGIPVFGRKGCSIHVQEVVRAFLAHGAEVDLFTPRVEDAAPPGLEPVRLHHLPIAGQKDPAAREQASLRANRHLRLALEQQGPFDLVYERYALWSHAAMDYAQAVGIPGLLEVNAPLIAEQARHRILVDRSKAEWVAHRAFGNATALIAVSREVAEYLAWFPNLDGRVHVIPNGVDPGRFPEDLAPSFPAAPGAFTVGFVGTLKPWHGLSTLVEAFARLHARAPAARLLIVGDGPERSRLEEDMARRGLEDVVYYTGAVAAGAVPGLIASMDAATAPYPNLLDFYFSPLKVYEYMAAGRAVVASRIGQLRDLIEHEITGLLFSPGDAGELASALMRLRSESGLRARLGEAARSRVRREHTWGVAVRRILDLAAPALAVDTRPACGVSR